MIRIWRRLLIALSFVLLTGACQYEQSDIQTIDVNDQVEPQAMDKLIAEDLSLSTRLFIKQLSMQLR